jgi:hypothetical protein
MIDVTVVVGVVCLVGGGALGYLYGGKVKAAEAADAAKAAALYEKVKGELEAALKAKNL